MVGSSLSSTSSSLPASVLALKMPNAYAPHRKSEQIQSVSDAWERRWCNLMGHDSSCGVWYTSGLCSLQPSSSPLFVQEPEPDDNGTGPGEVSSWDVNTERMTSTVGKLCKTESQNHMSPRYTADHYIWKHAHKILSLCFYWSYLRFLCFVNICVQLIGHLAGIFVIDFGILIFRPLLSKIENRMQRRPRSTSMKDRQNSKAQSDRTSSMDSECSPDSRLIAQVNHSQMLYSHSDVFITYDSDFVWSVSDSPLLVCLEGTEKVCVWPTEPNPDIWWTPTREHHSHQHYRVARTGVGFSIHIFR